MANNWRRLQRTARAKLQLLKPGANPQYHNNDQLMRQWLAVQVKRGKMMHRVIWITYLIAMGSALIWLAFGDKIKLLPIFVDTP